MIPLDCLAVYLVGCLGYYVAFMIEDFDPSEMGLIRAVTLPGPLVYVFCRYVLKIGSQKPRRFLAAMGIAYCCTPGLTAAGIWIAGLLGIG